MSDGIWIALINGIVTILAITISRLLSRREHNETKDKIDQLHHCVKTRLPPLVGECACDFEKKD